MIIAFASGKGGTGKTTVATNYALWLTEQKPAPNIQFLDCDVEEPNAAFFLKPKIYDSRSVAIQVPDVNISKCTFCGKCSEICVYNAIAVINPKDSHIQKEDSSNKLGQSSNTRFTQRTVLTFPELCHGCAGCTLICPEHAITEKGRPIGVVEKGRFDNMEFIQGRLNIAESMAPPIIRAIKKQIPVQKKANDIVIIDAPPGTSCPVIEAIKTSDFVVLVTEPTPFGLHDLILTVETLRILDIPFGVVVNRADAGDDKTEQYCIKEDITILSRIPMQRKIAVAYSQGIPMIRCDVQYKGLFHELHQAIIRETKKSAE
jgi:MinD superfamily P-loop ATPase